MDEKAETSSSAASAPSRLLREMSSNACSAPEDDLEHELAPEVGQDQEDGAGHDAIERDAAAPAVTMTADQDSAEDQPPEHRKHDLVRKAERLAENLLREQCAA